MVDRAGGGNCDRSAPFARHGDVALYVAGALMVAAGVVLENQAAVKTALVLIGAGLVLVGALLPRVTGTIEMGPQGIKIPIAVVARLEATRREAEQKAPDRVSEAVGAAYQALLPLLAAGDDLRFALHTPASQSHPSPREPTATGHGPAATGPGKAMTCPTCGHPNEEWEKFCGSCGAFLDWEAQRVDRAAPRSEQGIPDNQGQQAERPSELNPAAARPQAARGPLETKPSVKKGPLRSGPDDVICRQCGEDNERGRRFCRRCGESLSNAVSADAPRSQKRLSRRRTVEAPLSSGHRLEVVDITAESPEEFAARIVGTLATETRFPHGN